MKRLFLAVVLASLAIGPATAQVNPFGGPELVQYTKLGDVGGVRNALTRGARPNDSDVEHRTPLMYAAQDGDTEIIALLLEHKAAVRMRDNIGATAVAYAAQGGHVDAAEMLLAAGADIDAPDKQGFTPLMRAVRQGHIPMVEFLLQHKADVSLRDYTGTSALEWAKRQRQNLIVQMLEKAGAS